MAEEVGGGPSSNFLLENHISWPVFSNSDNSGGSTEDKSGNKKLLDSSSNSPTPTPTPTPTATTVTPSVVGQKRGRSGVPKSTTGKGGGGGDWSSECKVGGGGGGGGESDHEIHIWTERERRKKMRNMFSNLHALLPQLPAKADKSTIVDEAVNYIKTLQHSLQKLQKQRLEMLRGAPLTSTTIDYEPSVVVASTAPTFNSSREAFLADQGSSRNNSVMTNMNSPNSLSIPCIPASFQTWSSPNVVLSVNGDDAQISVCAPKKPGLLSTVCYVLEKHKLEVVTAHVSSDCYRSMFMIHAHASGACDQFPEALPVEEIYKLAVGEMIFWLSS
ncbi:Myc-type [Macleaya cordata]|uniref:Myc-type n=1 Tax=Macleaya cordata TaxID=56857 RepID=A0A200QZF6_MACCD|nr:Myc-type [Macleaya cordata]